MSFNDPILDGQFDDDEFEQEESTRAVFDMKKLHGRWPKAVLTDVQAREANDYGHSIALTWELDPEQQPDLKAMAFIDAPAKPEENGDPDTYEKALKRYSVRLNNIKTLVHATGYWVEFNKRGYKASTQWPKSLTDFATEEAYRKLVNLFSGLIGRNMPINIKVSEFNGKQRKDVWGLDPRQAQVV